jgi:hypothetical protein
MGTYSRILNDKPAMKDVAPSSEQTQPIQDSSVRTNDGANERTIFRTDADPNGRTALPSKRRLTRRYSFEFYEDQILHLKKLKFEAEMQGGTLYLSDIVRQALDRYFADGEQPDHSR